MFQGAGSEARFICLSTDVKPVTAAGIREFGIKAGDIVIETDTGRKFRFDGDGVVWQPADVSVNVTGSYVVQDAVIAHNGTQSTEIDFTKYKYLSFLMPAGWDAATITIKGSAVAGGTKVDIVNDAGVIFPALTVAVNKIYTIDVHALKIAGVHYLALVASAAQTTAARTIKVMCKA